MELFVNDDIVVIIRFTRTQILNARLLRFWIRLAWCEQKYLKYLIRRSQSESTVFKLNFSSIMWSRPRVDRTEVAAGYSSNSFSFISLMCYCSCYGMTCVIAGCDRRYNNKKITFQEIGINRTQTCR